MGIVVSGGRTPHYTRLMVFVDGTNFLVQLFKEVGVRSRAEKPPPTIFTVANELVSNAIGQIKRSSSEFIIIRRYWFASYAGNEENFKILRKILRENDYEPVLFKKDKDKPEKGVDISLTKEMLVNAFNNNYDIALLIAGDEDYVNLVKEVKRYGPIVAGAFFNHGLSPELQYTFDYFRLISNEAIGKEKLEALITKIKAELQELSS